MVKIRLTRTGKRNQPNYRVVVVEARSKRDGKYIESLGHFNPLPNPPEININKKRYQYWVAKGAQPTKTVAKLLSKV